MAPKRSNAAIIIDDVARAAGISTATVSRAFSRPHMLRPETVALVRKLADELGYQPNPAARALSTGRQGNIAIVLPDIANPFFPPLLRAAQAAADTAGYSVFLGDSDENAVREARLISKLTMQVEGFILASSRMTNRKILELGARQPVVLINRDISGIPRVLIDPAKGIGAAVAHLSQLGHKNIVYVSGPAASWSNQQREYAVEKSCAKHKLRLRTLPIGHPDFESGREITDKILALKRVTAVITFDDSVAHGLLAGLAERGIDVPRALSVIGCDDVLGASTYPALTSVSARCDEAGRLAFELLHKALNEDGEDDVRSVLDTWLVARGTTGPARTE